MFYSTGSIRDFVNPARRFNLRIGTSCDREELQLWNSTGGHAKGSASVRSKGRPYTATLTFGVEVDVRKSSGTSVGARGGIEKRGGTP